MYRNLNKIQTFKKLFKIEKLQTGDLLGGLIVATRLLGCVWEIKMKPWGGLKVGGFWPKLTNTWEGLTLEYKDYYIFYNRMCICEMIFAMFIRWTIIVEISYLSILHTNVRQERIFFSSLVQLERCSCIGYSRVMWVISCQKLIQRQYSRIRRKLIKNNPTERTKERNIRPRNSSFFWKDTSPQSRSR